jgi:hypothetical protein
VFQARFRKHTGIVVLALWQDSVVTGTYEQVRTAYRGAQVHNLCLGWWGILSLFLFNWIALFGNQSRMREVTAQATAAGVIR